jgi:hypothetical protein
MQTERDRILEFRKLRAWRSGRELRGGLTAGLRLRDVLAKICVYILIEIGQGLAEGLIGALDAADEHGSLEVADDAVGYGAGIDTGANGAGLDAVFDQSAQHQLPVAEGFADTIAQDWIAVIGVDCGVEQRTAAGQTGALDEVGDVLLDLVGVAGDGVEMDAAF